MYSDVISLGPSVSQSHIQWVLVQLLPLTWKGIATSTRVSRNVTVETVSNHGVTPVTRSGSSFHKAAQKLHALKLAPSGCAKRRLLPPSPLASCVRPVQGPLEGQAPRPGDRWAFGEGQVFPYKDGELLMDKMSYLITSLSCLIQLSPLWVLSYSPLMF